MWWLWSRRLIKGACSLQFTCVWTTISPYIKNSNRRWHHRGFSSCSRTTNIQISQMARATASKYRRLDDKRRARLSGGKMVQRQNEFSRRCGCNGAQSQEEESSLPPSFLGWQLRGKQRPRRLQGEMNKLQNMLGPASSGHKAEALWSKPGAESERASELWGGASQKKRKHSRATHNGSQDGNQATGRTQTIDFQAKIYTRVWGRPAAASLCSSLLTGLAFNKCIISKETQN